MTVRYYSSVAPPTTLSAGITSGAASIQVGSTTGFPALTPYTLSLDYGTSGEELVQVNSVGGTTLAVTRGIDGTSATSHLAGAMVRHVSSARDFADSRAHENADQEIHGLGPGEEIVGTDKAQTLANKTLNLATGTLNAIDIFNGPGWTTTINGDVANPTADVLAVKPTPSTTSVWQLKANGIMAMANTASNDSTPNQYKFRITRNDGSTDVYYVLAGGSVKSFLQNGVDGFTVQGSADGVRRRGVAVFDNDGTTARSVLYTDGTGFLNSKAPTLVTMDIQMAAAQSVQALRVRNSALTTLFSVSQTGQVNSVGLNSTGPVIGTTGSFSTITDSTTGFNVVPVKRGSQNVNFTSLSAFTVAVSFGATFPTIPQVSTNINTGDGTAARWNSRAININTTGFTLLVFAPDGGTTQTWVNIPVGWIAVGG
jgi:hypothetical protein